MMNKLISYFGTFTPGADGAVGAFQFEYLTSLGFAALVIFAGRAIVRRSHVLRKFAIPAPVISGLLFSVLIAIFKGTGILAISFDTNVSQRSATIASCMSMRWGGLTVTFPLRLDCYGHDLDLTQREMRYAAIPDLRDEYHPGMELESVVKVYDSTKDELIISVKETETNPILGAEQRHPVGSRRLAVISGKYGGGVFCNLPDGVVCMCNYSFQHEDSDFMVGENVMLVVQRYNEEKLQMFGKILSKW